MYTNITAHSGCEGTERDSLESIDRALALKADAIEIDVQLSGKRELRLSHNALTDEEYEAKPLVREAFERIADTNMMINCDIKTPKALYPLLDLAEDLGFTKERLILTGCTSPEQLIRDKTIKDRAKVIINLEELLRPLYVERFGPVDFATMKLLHSNPWKPYRDNPHLYDESMAYEIVKYIKELDLFGLNTSHSFTPDSLLTPLKEAGIPLSVWTVNDAEIAKRFFAAGAWNITTREPKLIMAARN